MFLWNCSIWLRPGQEHFHRLLFPRNWHLCWYRFPILQHKKKLLESSILSKTEKPFLPVMMWAWLFTQNATIQPIFAQIRNLRNENEKLAATRDALLPKLMSGELDVSNLTLICWYAFSAPTSSLAGLFNSIKTRGNPLINRIISGRRLFPFSRNVNWFTTWKELFFIFW